MKKTILGLIAFAFAVASAAARPAMPSRLDLPAALGLALENNFAIRKARERIRQEQGVLMTVRAAGLPSVAASATIQHSGISSVQPGPVPSFTPEGKFWRVSLVASQALYAGGGIRSSIRGAELTEDAAVLDFQSTVNGVLLQVRTRFYDVLLAREQVKVQEENVRLLETTLTDASRRVAAGTVSKFELLRAQVAVANAKPPLIQARNDYRLAIEDLRLLMGIESDRTNANEGMPDFVGALEFSPVKLDLREALDTAKAKRPDLLRLEKLTAALEESVMVARSSYYPRVTASVAGDFRTGATEKFSDSVSGPRASIQASDRVFDRAIGGKVAQVRSQLEQSRLAFDAAVFAANLEIRRALSDIDEASELAMVSQKAVGMAEEAFRIAKARYGAGDAVQLDVLKAETELTSARLSALRANHGFNTAFARLRSAMGFADVTYDMLDGPNKTQALK